MEEEDELARMLERLPDGDPWRVERVLKESPSEVTQLVRLRAGGVEVGPLVRKAMVVAPGVGEVWRRLFSCQQRGLRTRQLPRILACSEQAGRLEVVMERVPGPTLRERVLAEPEEGRPALARTLIVSLCSAARELNEDLGGPVVHRDITPSNVICSGIHGTTAVLVDLGIARAWHEGQEADTTHFGTRSYAPPEQFGFGQTDLRCDVYAIGMCALFCLVGRDPTPQDREAHFAVEGVPGAWREIIAKACAFDPTERFASAREMGEAIARQLGAPSEPDCPAGGQTLGAVPGQGEGRLRDRAARALASAWHARNLVVIPLVVMLVAASTVNVLDPQVLNRGNPWFNAFGYLVYVNYIVLALGYLAMDKSWLRSHVPALGRRTTGQVARVLAGIFAALTTALFVMSALLRA